MPYSPHPHLRRLRPIHLAAAALCQLACAHWYSSPAHAQVLRCADAHGRISYTNGACPVGTHTTEIEAAKTPEEREAERVSAEQAEQKRQQRAQQRQQERREQTIHHASSPHIAPVAEADYAATAACRQARQALEKATLRDGRYSREEQQRLAQAQDHADRACLSPQAYAEVVRQRRLAAPTQPVQAVPVWPAPATTWEYGTWYPPPPHAPHGWVPAPRPPTWQPPAPSPPPRPAPPPPPRVQKPTIAPADAGLGNTLLPRNTAPSVRPAPPRSVQAREEQP